MDARVLIQSAFKHYAAFPHPQWCYTENLIKTGQLASEIFKFESVDDGPLVYYKLTLWAKGSAELKIKRASLSGFRIMGEAFLKSLSIYLGDNYSSYHLGVGCKSSVLWFRNLVLHNVEKHNLLLSTWRFTSSNDNFQDSYAYFNANICSTTFYFFFEVLLKLKLIQTNIKRGRASNRE